jgi:hypothetical protein
MDEVLERLVAEKRAKERQEKYSTAAALVMARVMKRVAVKYADLGLARDANSLHKEALSALQKSNPRPMNSDGQGKSLKSDKRVVAGPSKIDGGVARVVEGRIRRRLRAAEAGGMGGSELQRLGTLPTVRLRNSNRLNRGFLDFRRSIFPLGIAAAAALSLSACGRNGALEIPPGPSGFSTCASRPERVAGRIAGRRYFRRADDEPRDYCQDRFRRARQSGRKEPQQSTHLGAH